MATRRQPTQPEGLKTSLRVSHVNQVIHGDCLEVLRGLPDACVDAIVTDPPAGISFMGKGWDSDKGGRRQWVAWLSEVMAECLRVLKPGGYALVWALPRTSHWTATALEDAGFEIRDCVTHLFGSGFPKSLDVSKAIDRMAGAQRPVKRIRRDGVGNTLASIHKTEGFATSRSAVYVETSPATREAHEWQGWGTALKPAAEFWWLCRKPLAEPTVAANVLRHGVGALNIAASRVGYASDADKAQALAGDAFRRKDTSDKTGWSRPWMDEPQHVAEHNAASKDRVQAGRWPANLLLSHAEDCTPAACSLWCPVRELDAQSGMRTSGLLKAGTRRSTGGGYMGHMPPLISGTYGGDTGGASRFFPTFRYIPKASRSERTHDGQVDNRHCTVKPLALMSWLITLITPPGGIVLDPFAGSGSTLVAAHQGGWRFIGIEREAEYVAIAEARLEATDEPSEEPGLGSATLIEQPKPAKTPRKRTPKQTTQPLWSAGQEMRA